MMPELNVTSLGHFRQGTSKFHHFVSVLLEFPGIGPGKGETNTHNKGFKGRVRPDNTMMANKPNIYFLFKSLLPLLLIQQPWNNNNMCGSVRSQLA
jgi:hypothetical protein